VKIRRARYWVRPRAQSVRPFTASAFDEEPRPAAMPEPHSSQPLPPVTCIKKTRLFVAVGLLGSLRASWKTAPLLKG